MRKFIFIIAMLVVGIIPLIAQSEIIPELRNISVQTIKGHKYCAGYILRRKQNNPTNEPTWKVADRFAEALEKYNMNPFKSASGTSSFEFDDIKLMAEKLGVQEGDVFIVIYSMLPYWVGNFIICEYSKYSGYIGYSYACHGNQSDFIKFTNGWWWNWKK